MLIRYCDELKIGMGTSLELDESAARGVAADEDGTADMAVMSSGVGSSSATLTSTIRSEVFALTATSFSMATAANPLCRHVDRRRNPFV